QDEVTLAAAVVDSPLDERQRLHGGMERTLTGLVHLPDITLVPCSIPVVLAAFTPAVENRLVLPWIVAPPDGEGVLSPHDEGGPVSAGRSERGLHGVQLRRTHADIAGAVGGGEDVATGCFEERPEARSEVIVGNLATAVLDGS